MEPVTTAGLIKTAGIEVPATAKREAEGFWKAVYAEPAKALGSLVALPLNRRLFRNAVKATVEANRLLKAAGVSPKQVPLSIIHPALQGAALEEDPSLQAIWANLLANAADPRKLAPVSAAFPTILKELSSREVKFLDALYNEVVTKANEKRGLFHTAHVYFSDSELHDIYTSAGLSQVPHFFLKSDDDEQAAQDLRSFSYMLAMLKRHNLIAESIWPHTVDRYDAVKNPKPDFEVEIEIEYSLSEIGSCFVVACRQPTPTVNHVTTT